MVAEAGEIAASDESHALAWVPLEELGKLADTPSLLRMRERLALLPGV